MSNYFAAAPRLRLTLPACAARVRAFKEGMFAKFKTIPAPTESIFLSANFEKHNQKQILNKHINSMLHLWYMV